MSEINIEVGYGYAAGMDSYAAGLEAAQQAAAIIKVHSVSVVLVFASVRYNLEDTLKGISHIICDAPILGTTTAGEICNSTRKESVVVLVLASPYLKVAVGVGENVSLNWENSIKQAVKTPELNQYFTPDIVSTHKRLTLEGKQAFGLLFSPGNTKHADSRSFEILEKLKQLSENRLPMFGGSSADDWGMDVNFVLYGKRAYPDSFLIAVFETSLQFGMALNHGFSSGSDQAVISKAEGHEVRELNGLPAAEVFARFVEQSVEELESKHLTFTTNRLIGIPDPYGQHSIKVASYFTPGMGIRLSQPVSNGNTLIIMRSDPDRLVSAGKKAFCKALLRGNVENPVAAIVFSCAVRQKLLGDRISEEISNISEIAPDVPVIGFYSFGEQGLADDGINRHNNGVITTLVIGKDLSYAAKVATENNLLSNQLEQSISNLNKQEEIVRKAEKRYRSLFDNASVGINLKSPQGTFMEANQALVNILGYSQEELKNLSFLDITHQDDVQLSKEKHDFLMRGDVDTYRIEKRYLGKGGKVIWVDTSVSALRDSLGNIEATVGIIADITERKQAEKALKESEHNFRTFFNAMDDMVVVANTKGKIIYSNPAMTKKLGYSLEELKNMHILALHQHEKRSEADAIFSAMFKGEFDVCPLPLQSKSGYLLPVETRVWFGTWSGELCIFGLCKDLSEEQDALQKFNRLFINNPAPMAVSSIPDRIFTDVNVSFINKLGYSRSEIIGKTSKELGLFVQPEKQDEVEKQLIMNGHVNNIELKARCKDRSILDGIFFGEIIESQGQKYFLTVMLDQTDRKHAEEALKASEEKFRLLIENSHDIIYTLTKDGKFLFVSPAWTTLLGHSVTQVIGQPFQPFVHPDDLPRFMVFLQLLIKTGERQGGVEYRVRHVDGTWHWHASSGVPFKGETSTVIGFYGIASDITERKQKEAELDVYKNNLEKLVESRTEALQNKAQQLKEINIALNILLEKRKEDKKNIEESVVKNVKDLIIPYLEKTKTGKLNSDQLLCIDIIEKHLAEIVSPLLKTLHQFNLTSREVQVATLINEGKSSKRIAEILGVAKGSIDIHRKNIRKKLGLSRTVNLQSRLDTLKQ